MHPSNPRFDHQPLAGKAFLVTREAERGPGLTSRLEGLGAFVHAIPVVQTVPPANRGPLLTSVNELASYDWVIFTSKNAVNAIVEALAHEHLSIRELSACKLAAVGEATAARMVDCGINVDLVPPEFVAESLVSALMAREPDLSAKSILLPRAADARSVIPDALRACGARVNMVEAYQTLRCTDGRQQILDLLNIGRLDGLTFTASSALLSFDALLDVPATASARRVPCFCLGPIVAKKARMLGYAVAKTPQRYDLDGLVESISLHFTQN